MAAAAANSKQSSVSGPPKDVKADRKMSKYLDSMASGSKMLKLGKFGRPHSRVFTLTDNYQRVSWKSWNTANLSFGRSVSVDLHSAQRVQRGMTTATALRFKLKYMDVVHRAFSIIYGDNRTLDVIIIGDGKETEEEAQENFDAWFFGLDFLIRKYNAEKELDPFQAFLRSEWLRADKDGNGTLDLGEVGQLVKKLNGNLSAKYIKKIFLQVDVDGSGCLDFEEFVSFIHVLLRREELELLWRRVVRAPPNISTEAALQLRATADQFLRFLQEEQGEYDMSRSRCMELLSKLDRSTPVDAEPHDTDAASGSASSSGELGYEDFRVHMSGPANDVFTPSRQLLHHDMTQPLNHYYMASSHNTYLEGNQLNSNSSVNRYIDDLLKGCRCVELDCWDGEDGEPIIYHGHTLTTKILFRDVIKAVSDYAFEVSPYPVVLSLENHCGVAQQRIMAKHLKEMLGDAGLLPDTVRDFTRWPSPEELKGKVIIKGKCFAKGEEAEEVSVSDSDDSDSEEGGAHHTHTHSSSSSSRGQGPEQDMDSFASDKMSLDGSAKKKKRVGRTLSKLSSSVSLASTESRKTDKKKKKKAKFAQELSDLVAMRGTHFKSFEHTKEHGNSFEVCSMKENKMERLMARNCTGWVHFNQQQFSRIYPGGFRVDSSNYNPIPAWSAGNQIVALNYQTPGESMQINDGKFLENGGCGYLLMPPQLREPGTKFHPSSGPWLLPPMQLRVTVISAQQLPKPRGEQKGELIDPYCCVDVHGLNDDTQKGQRTRTVVDNGLNPQWGQRFVFAVQAPEFAVLSLTVWDEDATRDDFIAYGCVPLPCLRAGYRTLPLRNQQGKRTAEFQHASLFIFVEMLAM